MWGGRDRWCDDRLGWCGHLHCAGRSGGQRDVQSGAARGSEFHRVGSAANDDIDVHIDIDVHDVGAANHDFGAADNDDDDADVHFDIDVFDVFDVGAVVDFYDGAGAVGSDDYV